MMGSFRFIHCADLHLGSRFVGISSDNENIGKRMRESTFKALDRIVLTAKKNDVDFVIFSGDIFDDENETPLTRSRFADALSKIKVKCFIAYGNHDRSRKWEDSIPLPDNAHVFSDKTERISFPDEGEEIVEIFGISYSKKHSEKDLTEGMKGNDDTFSIGVLHCDLDSVSEDSRYAPCKLSTLLGTGIDYWALGHIHKRQVVNEYPHVVYPGNTQGRNPKESGEKGAYIVTVTRGRVTDMEFFRTGDVVWRDVESDITGRKDVRDVVNDIQSNTEKNSFVRITLTGHGDLDRMLRLDAPGFTELLEKRSGCTVTGLKLNTLPDIDLEERKEAGDFTSAVIDFGKKLETSRKEDIIDVICSTTTSAAIRPMFESMDTDELRSIARDSMLFLMERMMEARK